MIKLDHFVVALADCVNDEPEIIKLAQISPTKGNSNKTERLSGIPHKLAGLVILVKTDESVIYAGKTGDMRAFVGGFTNPTLVPSPNSRFAITHEYVACKIALDGQVITALGVQMQTKQHAKTAVEHLENHFGDVWPSKSNLLIGYSDIALARFKKAAVPESEPKSASGGWPPSPNIERNALVEQAAIDAVRSHFGQEGRDRQADNCGWDLEFKSHGTCICVEVKGVSGQDPVAAVSVNEYRAMQRVMGGEFQEGVYRLAIVTNALDDPIVHIFTHETENRWKCELTGQVIEAVERTAALLS